MQSAGVWKQKPLLDLKWSSCSERCVLGVASTPQACETVSISKDQFLICSSIQEENAYGKLITISVFWTVLVICLWLCSQVGHANLFPFAQRRLLVCTVLKVSLHCSQCISLLTPPVPRSLQFPPLRSTVSFHVNMSNISHTWAGSLLPNLVFFCYLTSAIADHRFFLKSFKHFYNLTEFGFFGVFFESRGSPVCDPIPLLKWQVSVCLHALRELHHTPDTFRLGKKGEAEKFIDY